MSTITRLKTLSVGPALPSPLVLLFRAAKAVRVTWSKRSELTERDWENAGTREGPVGV